MRGFIGESLNEAWKTPLEAIFFYFLILNQHMSFLSSFGVTVHVFPNFEYFEYVVIPLKKAGRDGRGVVGHARVNGCSFPNDEKWFLFCNTLLI